MLDGILEHIYPKREEYHRQRKSQCSLASITRMYLINLRVIFADDGKVVNINIYAKQILLRDPQGSPFMYRPVSETEDKITQTIY